MLFSKIRLSGTYLYVKYEKLILKKDSGNYYVKLENAKKIPLSGSCTGGSLTLQESDSSGKPVGTFQGSFTKPQIVEGTWSTPDGKRTLPFHLQVLLPTDRVSGKYRTDDSLQELDILLLDGGEIHIQGAAYWVNEITGSVHDGEVDSTSKLEEDKAYYVESASDPDTAASRSVSQIGRLP